MKKIILSLAAVSALAIGAPAAAQYASQPNGGYGNNGYNNEANGNVRVAIGRLQARLDAGIRSGGISRQEAYPLRQQIRQLTVLERQYGVNGLSGRERADLQQRLRDVRQRLRMADGNGANWNRYDREDGYGPNGQYGADDRYGRDGQYGNGDRYGDDDRIDANQDGYDDRDYNRDGRWDDDARQGSYQQPGRNTVGGVLDQMLGGGSL